jgi:inner membrane protein
MDNLAHSLFGLSLAKAGLDKTTPMATAALVISSNLPDIDVIVRLNGDTLTYLRYHRGFTHSLVGVFLLAGALTFLLSFVHRWRGKRRPEPFVPAKQGWLFMLSTLGGLGHTLFDYTNSYGVRPFLPFSNEWCYGDLIFVADPWIWLILGSGAAWLTAVTRRRKALWVLLGLLTSLPILLIGESPAQPGLAVPAAAKIGWFTGVGLVIGGVALGWKKLGANLARASLILLAVYYGGMAAARSGAVKIARSDPAVQRAEVWPVPANPMVWQAVTSSPRGTETGYVRLSDSQRSHWKTVQGLDSKLLESLRRAERSRQFLEFSRFWNSNVDETETGYAVILRDLRFTLRMEAEVERDTTVRAVNVSWY